VLGQCTLQIHNLPTYLITVSYHVIGRFHTTQLDNPAARWILSEGFSVVYADIEGEMVVGGVFLRLFVANPGWVLRKPKEFITELLEKWSEIVSISNPNVCCLLFTFRQIGSKVSF